MPNEVVIDFTNVQDRDFNIKHLPPGDYPAKITKIVDHESKSGNANWLYTFTVISGPGKGASYPYYAGLDVTQAWKIRNIYGACGIIIPKKKVRLKKDQVLNKTCAITLDDDEYEGKLKSVIAAVIPMADLGKSDAGDEDVADEDEEEVEEAPPLARKKKAKPAPIIEDEDEKEAEDEDEDEEEAPPPPRKTVKKAAKAKPAVEEDDDELEELELEDL